MMREVVLLVLCLTIERSACSSCSFEDVPKLPCTMHTSVSTAAGLKSAVQKVTTELKDAVSLIHLSSSPNPENQPARSATALSSAVEALSRATRIVDSLDCPVLAAIIYNNLGLALYLRKQGN